MGDLEVSTDYSWQEAQELLSVNTEQDIYRLDNLERLDFVPKRSAVLGIPLEKVLQSRTSVVNLYGRNAFLPTDNQLVTQGFFSEIRTFADKVEHQGKKRKSCVSDLESIQDTYWLISEIREYLDKKYVSRCSAFDTYLFPFLVSLSLRRRSVAGYTRDEQRRDGGKGRQRGYQSREQPMDK